MEEDNKNNELDDKIEDDLKKRNKMPLILLLLFCSFCAITGGTILFLNSKNGSNPVEIKGNENIPSSEWKIEINNIKKEVKGKATFNKDVVVSKSKLELTYGLSLYEVGDSAVISFDIENNGTIDAKLNKLPELNVLSDKQKKYLNYKVTYSDGINLSKGDVIESMDSVRIRIYISVKDGVNISDIANDKIDCSFTINYVQYE